MTVTDSCRRGFLTVGLALAIGFSAAANASAADNGDEVKCQLGTSLEIGKFIRSKSKCIDGCQKRVFEGDPGTSPADCLPPYGGKTGGCVQSAEGEAGGQIQSHCSKDCPECYTGGDCPADADVRVADAEAHVEAFAADIFCDDSASPDALNLSEFKCQRTVQKVIAHFAAGKLKCMAKCRKLETSGKVPGLTCSPPNDVKIQACIDKLETKAAFLIDKKCEAAVNPSADKPECAPYPVRDGAAWVAAEEAAVDSRLPSLFCNDTTTTTTTTLP